MWLKHVNWNAQRYLYPKSLLEVSYKVWTIYIFKALHMAIIPQV